MSEPTVEPTVAPAPAEEAPKKRAGRPAREGGGEFLTTTIRIPKQLGVEVKRIAFVNGSTQEQEITASLEHHVNRVKGTPEYKSKLQALLSE